MPLKLAGGSPGVNIREKEVEMKSPRREQYVYSK